MLQLLCFKENSKILPQKRLCLRAVRIKNSSNVMWNTHHASLKLSVKRHRNKACVVHKYRYLNTPRYRLCGIDIDSPLRCRLQTKYRLQTEIKFFTQPCVQLETARVTVQGMCTIKQHNHAFALHATCWDRQEEKHLCGELDRF